MKTNKFITVSSAVLLSAGMLGAVSAVNANNSVQTVQAAKRFNYSKFRKKIMKKCHISKKLVNRYTGSGIYHRGNIVSAIKHPTKYARYNKKSGTYTRVKKNGTFDEYYVASSVLSYKKSRTKKTAVKPNTGTSTSSSSSSSTVKPRVNNPSDRSNSSTKSSSAESFKQKVMKATGITEKQFNDYTYKGFYKNGDIADAINNPTKYVKNNGDGDYLKANDSVTDDEYDTAVAVLEDKDPTHISYSSDDAISLNDSWKRNVTKYFIQYVNNWRKEQGLSELKTGNDLLQKAADTRANELITLFSHTRPDGRSCETAEIDLGLEPAAECIGAMPEKFGIPAKTFAYIHFSRMIYHDEASNWGHRDILKSTRYTQIAVSESYKKVDNEYEMRIVAELL